MRIAYLALAFALISLVSSANLELEREHISESILDSYMNQPEKDLFKVYHFIFDKPYSLNTDEGIRRYKLFKKALSFIKTHNSKGLSWTVALNHFADMTNEEYDQFNNLSIPSETKSNLKKNRRSLGFFDEMADKIDNDDDIPIPKINDDENTNVFTNVNHKKYLSDVKNQGSCGSCWAFTAALTIEAAYNVLANSKNTTNITLVEPVSTQQLVDCDPKSSGCNGGWMPYAFDYLSNSAAQLIAFEKDYSYTAKTGSCNAGCLSKGVKVTGHEGCAPWFGYGKCDKKKFHDYLEKSPVGVAIDTKHDGFRYYRKGIIDVYAYENTETPYKCDRLTHAIVAYGWTNQEVPEVGSRVYISLRNSWGTKWGESGDFHIYVTEDKDYNSSCYITKIASRPIVSLE